MKKTFRMLALGVVAVAACVGVAACGDDDGPDGPEGSGDLWKGELSKPKYDNDAVLYLIDNNSEIGSIELTSSGNYIILPPDLAPEYVGARSLSAGSRTPFRKIKGAAGSRTIDPYGEFGTFTKEEDGTVVLEGLGTLSPYENGEITLTYDYGDQVILNPRRVKSIPENRLNQRFCRTWEVVGATVSAYRGNKLIEKYKYTDEELRDEYVNYVVITKFGTYVQVEWDGSIADNGTWRWNDQDSQEFFWQFTDNIDDCGYSQVAFDGNKATFISTYEEDGYTYKEEVVARAK